MKNIFPYHLVLCRVGKVRAKHGIGSPWYSIELINDRTGVVTEMLPGILSRQVPRHAVHEGDIMLCCEYEPVVFGLPQRRCLLLVCKYNGPCRSGDRLVPPGYRETTIYGTNNYLIWDELPRLEQEYCTMDTLVSKYQKKKL